MKRLFVLVFTLVIIIALPSCAEGRAEVYSAYCISMDTRCEVRVYGAEHAGAADACKALLATIEDELSVTDEGSKTYALNIDGKSDIGEHLGAVADVANRVKSITGGAYDPCIYPLVSLWGFTKDSFRVPAANELSEAVAKVAASSLSVSNGQVTVTDGAVDFGGIAKGYAAEVLADSLKADGVGSAFISLGGNIRTLGMKPDGTLWNIGISDPQGGLLGVLSLGECAVVTSGSYIRNFAENGKTYHHIIDPKTGYPADNGLLSVTVVCDNAAIADGLSTAFFVMGLENATLLAKELGVETVFVTDDAVYISSGLKEKFTPDASVEGVYSVVYN